MRLSLSDKLRLLTDKWYGLYAYEILMELIKYDRLVNRAPKLGDFIACDEEGLPIRTTDPSKFNMLDPVARGYYEDACREHKAAKSRVIFKGEWEVVKGSNSNHTRIYCEQLYTTIDFELSEVSLIRTDRSGFVLERGGIDRIENLPREIEFKDNLI